MEDAITQKIDRLAQDQHNHEINFVKFQAVSEERYKTTSDALTNIVALLKTQSEQDVAHVVVMNELNTRVTTIEVEKKTIAKMNKVWLALAVLAATLLAGPATKAFEMIINNL